MATTLTPQLMTAALEMTFIAYAVEEFGEEEGFPSMDKVSRLVDAITSEQTAGEEVSAEDVLNALLVKYNITD